MEYVGTSQIENTKRNYEKKLQQQFNIILKKNKEKLNQQIPNIVNSIKNEIMGFFQVVAYQEFQLIFYKHYGHNYDENSLNKSLSFYIDDRLQPHVTYDVKNFYIKSDFDADRKSFNQNVNVEGTFDRLMEFNALDAVEELEFFGLSIGEDSPYSWATDDISEISDKKVFSRNHKNKIFNPKEIYEEAVAKTMEVFWSQYETFLRPKLLRKYGLKL